MRVVNACTVHPADIRPGDVMLFVVKALVVREGFYRLYRCPYGPDSPCERVPEEDIPQGSRLGRHEAKVCLELFPSLAGIADPDPY